MAVWPHTFVCPSAFSRRAVVSYWRKYVHEVLVNRLGGLSLPRKSVVRLTDRPDMTLDVYRGRKTTIQHATVYGLINIKELCHQKQVNRYTVSFIFIFSLFTAVKPRILHVPKVSHLAKSADNKTYVCKISKHLSSQIYHSAV